MAKKKHRSRGQHDKFPRMVCCLRDWEVRRLLHDGIKPNCEKMHSHVTRDKALEMIADKQVAWVDSSHTRIYRIKGARFDWKKVTDRRNLFREKLGTAVMTLIK